MKTMEAVLDPPEVKPRHEAVVLHEKRELNPLSPELVKQALAMVRKIMDENMKKGIDYGFIPGCGMKPSLFQPGAQKLSLAFGLNIEKLEEEITDYAGMHRGYRLTVRAINASRYADGVGECSTLETKYRHSKNPPDYWNTARKISFKRAQIHAVINATNSSELWSQDLEDLRENGVDTGQDQYIENPKPANDDPRHATVKPATKCATEVTRKWAFDLLKCHPNQENYQNIHEFFVKAGCILVNESLEDVPLRFIPASQAQMRQLGAALADFGAGEPATRPFVNADPETEPSKEKQVEVPAKGEKEKNPLREDWELFPIPFGKQAGKTLGQVDRKYLYGFWAGYEVETTYRGKPRKPEAIRKDQAFRDALDAAGMALDFKLKKKE